MLDIFRMPCNDREEKGLDPQRMRRFRNVILGRKGITMKAGFIGFITPEMGDPYKELEKYAQIGYTGMESGDLLLQGDVKENVKRVRDMGLIPLTVHCPDADADAGELIRKAQAVGVSYVVNYALCAAMYRFNFRETDPDYDEFRRELEKMDKLAGELKKEGIQLLFHNHDVDFTKCYKGVPAMYLMSALTENLNFEVDTGWVTYAGHDPQVVLRDLGERVSLIHVKDFVCGEVPRKGTYGSHTMPRFTTPGTGKLNLRGVLQTASEMGIPYAIVEQDFQYHLTELETLTAAYLNMKETGFVD